MPLGQPVFMKKLVLIDGNALIHRGFHALPPLKTSKGELINAVYGFTTVLLNILSKEKPEYIAVAFDKKGPTFRHKAFPDYKATRVKAPDELYMQIPRVKEVVKAFEIPIFETAGFEADDVLGTLASQAEKKKNVKALIVTGDLDVLQLVSAKTNVLATVQGFANVKVYDRKAVKERYGLSPDQIVDFKALRGDASDNIPGVSGIGQKTATSLLQKFGTLKNIYKNLGKIKGKVEEKLEYGKENAFLSQKLAEIVTKVPVKLSLQKCEAHDFDHEKVKKLFIELEFFRFIKRVEEWIGEKEGKSEVEQPTLF